MGEERHPACLPDVFTADQPVLAVCFLGYGTNAVTNCASGSTWRIPAQLLYLWLAMRDPRHKAHRLAVSTLSWELPL